MCDPRIIARFAALFVALAVGLGMTVHPAWYWLALVVAANLFQSTFTGFCPLERILGRWRLFGCRPY